MIKSHVETREEKRIVIDAIVCDVCKKEYKARPEYNNAVEWGLGAYEKDVTALWFQRGDDYPESDQTVTTRFDICPSCFDNHIVPFLRGLGAVGIELEAD